MGGNIIRVGSKINHSSILVYDKAKNYKQFEFIWNPAKDAIVVGGAAGPQIGTPAGQPTQSSPFGASPGSPGSNPNNPNAPFGSDGGQPRSTGNNASTATTTTVRMFFERTNLETYCPLFFVSTITSVFAAGVFSAGFVSGFLASAFNFLSA